MVNLGDSSYVEVHWDGMDARTLVGMWRGVASSSWSNLPRSHSAAGGADVDGVRMSAVCVVCVCGMCVCVCPGSGKAASYSGISSLVPNNV